MTPCDYIQVRNWEKFQHYKDRRPPWIKFYVDLLEDEELRELDVTTRLVYCLLLLVAAKRDNLVPYNLAWLAEELALPRRKIASAVASLIASEHASVVASPRARTRSASASPSEVLQGKGECEGGTTLAVVKARPRDELWDAIVAEIGEPQTKSERGRTNKAVAELREAGATALEVRERAASYRRRWPSVDLTATALVSNWTTLAQPIPVNGRDSGAARTFALAQRLEEEGR